MNFDAITLKDMARSLGLSVSTVSKALRDSYEISEKTKKLVLAYAEKHNYKPNPIAQSLKRGKSHSIGVIISSIDNVFMSQVISGVEAVAYDKGYNVIITQTHESYDREILNLQELTSRSVDGILLSLSTETKDVSHLKQLHQKGLPIVFFDRVSDEIETHKVIADNRQGAYDATKHLIDSGYKRIAHITSSASASITKERLEGYIHALNDAGMQADERYIKYCYHGGQELAEIELVLQQLLDMDERPDAIFAASDRITTTVLTLLHQLNISIPNEMALLGFTNITLADVLNPALTSVYQPAFDMGKIAAGMLISIIESKRAVTEFETRMLDTHLYIRKSSVKKQG
jgi:LacI family transcriptional regulator